ncbi:MAG: hemerythrin domain-containing protein [Methanobacteriota archaeon]|nr:MAG: hemerythrin domain-containing protein [Euryarchaeota archaeon]
MGDVPDDDPFSAVLADHADFVDKLTELEATLDEMMATRDASEENGIILDEAIRFFDDELLPFLAAEDETILPRLEAAIGRYGTLVNVVGYEHAEIRRGVEKFKDARRALGRQPSWSAIQEANRHGIFLVQFLWDHFRKERTSLYPTARQRLAASDLEAIRKRFAH